MLIEVYEDSMSDKVIKTFKSINDLVAWQEKEAPDLDADQVAIDGMIMLGWDEILGE